jgi:hypothetical protein
VDGGHGDDGHSDNGLWNPMNNGNVSSDQCRPVLGFSKGWIVAEKRNSGRLRRPV